MRSGGVAPTSTSPILGDGGYEHSRVPGRDTRRDWLWSVESSPASRREFRVGDPRTAADGPLVRAPGLAPSLEGAAVLLGQLPGLRPRPPRGRPAARGLAATPPTGRGGVVVVGALARRGRDCPGWPILPATYPAGDGAHRRVVSGRLPGERPRSAPGD